MQMPSVTSSKCRLGPLHVQAGSHDRGQPIRNTVSASFGSTAPCNLKI